MCDDKSVKIHRITSHDIKKFGMHIKKLARLGLR